MRGEEKYILKEEKYISAFFLKYITVATFIVYVYTRSIYIYNFIEVKLPYEFVSPPVGRSVGRPVGRSVGRPVGLSQFP